jgi:hypothetical protein
LNLLPCRRIEGRLARITQIAPSIGRPIEAVYDLDAFFTPDKEDNNLFDVSDNEGSGSETDVIDIKDLGVNVNANDNLED